MKTTTDAFKNCASALLQAWEEEAASGNSDSEALIASLHGRLTANMVLVKTDTSSKRPADFMMQFLHRYNMPSAILEGGDPQRDQKFSEFRDQGYLYSTVVPIYRSVIASRKPYADRVTTKLTGYHILFDRLLVPEPVAECRPRWCLSLSEIRCILPVPHGYPEMDIEDIKVLQLLREGDSARDIGEKIGCSRRTVEGRIERLRKRFGARNVAHLIAMSVTHAFDMDRPIRLSPI
jgi:DNA-binding HTH domain-containing proteins